MEGKVKYFNVERAFGFIAVPDQQDRFFHISELQGSEIPKVGDAVSFEPASGRDGRPVARQIVITQRASESGRNGYYAKPHYREEVVTPGSSRMGRLGSMGVLGTLGALVGGPLGAAIGAGLGAIVGPVGEDREAVTRQVPITRTCIRCGGNGHVTAVDDGVTGFQCPNCKSFWKVRDKNLTDEERSALGKPSP